MLIASDMNRQKTHKGYNLEEARQGLELWKEAKRAAATGKSYKIGSRELTRQDLPKINAEIDLFADIVQSLSTHNSGIYRVSARQKRW